MNTPADKPVLPALPNLPKWAADIMTTAERQSLRQHIQRQIDAAVAQARADERRKALEEAEARLRQRLDAAKHVHKTSGGSYSEGMRDAYDVAVLDIGSMIDRKEPT